MTLPSKFSFIHLSMNANYDKVCNWSWQSEGEASSGGLWIWHDCPCPCRDVGMLPCYGCGYVGLAMGCETCNSGMWNVWEGNPKVSIFFCLCGVLCLFHGWDPPSEDRGVPRQLIAERMNPLTWQAWSTTVCRPGLPFVTQLSFQNVLAHGRYYNDKGTHV